MSDDIVARLRDAGECPTPLRAYLARAVVLQAADEIERLRAERDEARWRLCKVVGDNRGVWGCEIAKENGWDYLATEAKP
jgi:hypothetical protein